MNNALSAQASSRCKVLLVDDDPWMLKIMAAALCEDADVTTSTSGEGALGLVRGRRFDVVCSDLLMPRMNGLELLAAVAVADEEIGCLLVTGAADHLGPEDRRRHRVLRKPFDPEDLIALVLELAAASRKKRRAREPASCVHPEGSET